MHFHSGKWYMFSCACEQLYLSLCGVSFSLDCFLLLIEMTRNTGVWKDTSKECLGHHLLARMALIICWLAAFLQSSRLYILATISAAHFCSFQMTSYCKYSTSNYKANTRQLSLYALSSLGFDISFQWSESVLSPVRSETWKDVVSVPLGLEKQSISFNLRLAFIHVCTEVHPPFFSE